MHVSILSLAVFPLMSVLKVISGETPANSYFFLKCLLLKSTGHGADDGATPKAAHQFCVFAHNLSVSFDSMRERLFFTIAIVMSQNSVKKY